MSYITVQVEAEIDIDAALEKIDADDAARFYGRDLLDYLDVGEMLEHLKSNNEADLIAFVAGSLTSEILESIGAEEVKGYFDLEDKSEAK